jgi:hypothetical protein
VKLNFDPAPTVLVAHRSPPMRMISRRLRVSPRPHPAASFRDFAVALGEILEQPRQLRAWNTNPGIDHVNGHGPVVQLGRDGHLPSLGELDGIGDQIGERLGQAGWIRQDLRQRPNRRLDDQPKSLGFRGGLLRARNLLDDFIQVQRLGTKSQVAPFQAQQIDVVPQAPS